MIARPKSLTALFQEGVDARIAGKKAYDNPYCPDTDERTEWAAGWAATMALDEDDDPASDRVHPEDDD